MASSGSNSSNGTIGGRTVEGVVQQTNDKGVKIAGDWYNQSKFNPVTLPGTGMRVRLVLGDRDYINSIDILDGAAAAVPPANGPPNAAAERRILRSVAMKAAAELIGAFAQRHEEVRTEHVFPLADRILAWLERDDDADDTAS